MLNETWSGLGRSARIGLVTGVLAIAALWAIVPGIFAPHDPYNGVDVALLAPNGEYIFGTDAVGRDLFSRLIDRLVDASAEYLRRQFAAGADAAQIFDSWAGVLPPAEFERWCVAPIKAIAAKVRAETPNARLIAFPRGAGTQLAKFARLSEIDAIGLDTAVEPGAAIAALPERFTFQGNLDPLALVAGGAALDTAIDRILAAFPARPHIFNLGHGIVPDTPIAHVEHLIKRVRGG